MNTTSANLCISAFSALKRAGSNSPHLRGSMLLEAIVSATLLASLLVIINQTVVQLHRQTRFADRHFIAQQTLENLLEEFSNRPWADMTTAAVGGMQISEYASAKLPHVSLSGEVIDEQDPAQAKQITLHLNWQNVPGAQQQPLSLTTWVYKQPEANP